MDGVVSSRPVFFQTCPTAHRQGLGAPPSPMGNVSYLQSLPSLAIPRRPSPSLAVPLLSLVFKSSGLTHFFPTIIYIFSFYSLVLCLLPCSSLSLSVLYYTITQSGLIEPEVEMQLSHYHRCWGCSFAMVDFVKNFPYRRVLCIQQGETPPSLFSPLLHCKPSLAGSHIVAKILDSRAYSSRPRQVSLEGLKHSANFKMLIPSLFLEWRCQRLRV